MVLRSAVLLAWTLVMPAFAFSTAAAEGISSRGNYASDSSTANLRSDKRIDHRERRRGTERAGRHGYKGHPGSHGARHEAVVGGAGVPSVLPRIGTYAGSVAAARVRGVGVYFAIDGFGGGDIVKAPKGRIVFVEDGPDCSWEAGVCVVRGR